MELKLNALDFQTANFKFFRINIIARRNSLVGLEDSRGKADVGADVPFETGFQIFEHVGTERFGAITERGKLLARPRQEAAAKTAIEGHVFLWLEDQTGAGRDLLIGPGACDAAGQIIDFKVKAIEARAQDDVDMVRQGNFVLNIAGEDLNIRIRLIVQIREGDGEGVAVKVDAGQAAKT